MESQDANYHILILLLGHAKTVPYQQLLNIADISTIAQRRLCQSLVLLYKSIYCNGPQHTKDRFRIRKISYNIRGNGSKLELSKLNLEWMRPSFSSKARIYCGTVFLRKLEKLPTLMFLNDLCPRLIWKIGSFVTRNPFFNILYCK